MSLHHPGPAYFDETLGTWILSRFDDVQAALRDPHLAVHGTTVSSSHVHHEVRRATHVPAKSFAWHTAMVPHAVQLVRALPINREVDLTETVFAPWARALSMTVATVPVARADECLQLARTVFLTAASATDGTPRAEGSHAAASLANLLGIGSAGAPRAADVQSFVAVSQSLPALLTSITHALMHDEPQQQALCDDIVNDTVQWPLVIAELLRFASPSRAVFRVAIGDRHIAEAPIRDGDRVALLLSAANRDPSRFTRPDQLDLQRDAARHLSFGAGTHRCAGATLVEAAVQIVLDALLRHCPSLHPADDAAGAGWIGGFATRAPAGLLVMSRTSSTD